MWTRQGSREKGGRFGAIIGRMEYLEDDIGRHIVDAAVSVHRELGPGLLETVYEVVLADELRRRGYQVERQIQVAITYCGKRFHEGFRVDLIVGDRVIVELKCVDLLTYVHRRQLLTYLRLADKRLGYLLNFRVPLMKRGIVRIVNRLPEQGR